MKLSAKESLYFNEEYQASVKTELKRGKDFAYSYNEIQYKKIKEMAEEIAEKKTKKTGAEFIVQYENFGCGDTKESSIVGWKVVQVPAPAPAPIIKS